MFCTQKKALNNKKELFQWILGTFLLGRAKVDGNLSEEKTAKVARVAKVSRAKEANRNNGQMQVSQEKEKESTTSRKVAEIAVLLGISPEIAQGNRKQRQFAEDADTKVTMRDSAMQRLRLRDGKVAKEKTKEKEKAKVEV